MLPVKTSATTVLCGEAPLEVEGCRCFPQRIRHPSLPQVLVSKFEWMELETLSKEIAHSQSRLDAARATKNHGLVKLLQREIGETAERRARILAGITKGLGVAGSARSHPSPVPVQTIEAEVAEGEQQ